MTTAVLSKISSIEFPEINWKAACLLGFLIILTLLSLYVWLVNDLTKGSYLTADFERQINKLSQENRDLEISFAESSFLGQALMKVQALNFQKTTSIKYIKILDNSVARANQ